MIVHVREIRRFSLFVLIPLLSISLNAQIFLNHSNSKYQTAYQVYQNLILAFGRSTASPSLELNKRTVNGIRFIASYQPGTNPVIILDEEVYDLCCNYGNDSLDALASILAHELTHYFMNHNFCSDFAFILGEKSPLAKQMLKISVLDKKKSESEADYYGNFYGYVAGYSTYETMPHIIKDIYKHYSLPNEIRGYPSLQERISIANESVKQVKEWIALFDAGELLFILKRYDAAFTCFQKLSAKFPSREIFNNAGTMLLFSAIEDINQNDFPFSLPIEYDPMTRLKQGQLRSEQIDSKMFVEKLNSAIELFDKAIKKDPKYFNATINKACAYILLKNYPMAEGLIIELKKSMTSKISEDQLSRIYAVQGIVATYQNQFNQAEICFDSALTIDHSPINEYNAFVYKENHPNVTDIVDKAIQFLFSSGSYKPPAQRSIPLEKEKIGGKSADQLDLTYNNQQISFSDNQFPWIIYYKDEDTYGNYFFYDKTYHCRIKAIATQFGYTGKCDKNIGRYDPVNRVKIEYGLESYSIRTPFGRYLVYRQSNIAFFIDSKGKIQQWWVYQFE